MKRTHHCNEIRPADAGKTVILEGWVHSRRDLGGLLFIDIRDREGRTQTVFDPANLPSAVFDSAARLHSESVVRATGEVRLRPTGTDNSRIATGQVEVMVRGFEVLNAAAVLPFAVDDPEIANKVNEELRLKYRYLDLRRQEMIRNLRLRSKVAIATRQQLDEQGFLEVQRATRFVPSSKTRARTVSSPCFWVVGRDSPTPPETGSNGSGVTTRTAIPALKPSASDTSGRAVPRTMIREASENRWFIGLRFNVGGMELRDRLAPDDCFQTNASPPHSFPSLPDSNGSEHWDGPRGATWGRRCR